MKPKLKWSLHTGGEKECHISKIGNYFLEVNNPSEKFWKWTILINDNDNMCIGHGDSFSKEKAQIACEKFMRNRFVEFIKILEG